MRRWSTALLLRRSPSVSHTATSIVARLSHSVSKPDNDSDWQGLGHGSSNESPSLAIPYAFVQDLSSAAKFSSIYSGEQYHAAIVKLGFTSNLFITTALVNVYSRCHSYVAAQKVFDEMPHRNVVTWNTLIYCYAQSRVPVLALRTFAELISSDVSLTPSSISSVLVACSRLEDVRIGAMLHSIGSKLGFCSDVVVATALVDMYSKCSLVDAAKRMFDEMVERNVITWTSLLTGYALDLRPLDAMLLIREMKRLGVGTNEVTYSSLLSSFSRSEDLVHSKQVHCCVIEEGLECDPYIAVALVTMYSKCGSLEDFVKACSSLTTEDQISCNSVIAGFSHLGDGVEALGRFFRMRRECINIDFFTLASILRAIGILSALKEGRQTHALILKSGHASIVCIQNGLVSMYAKCGAIDDSKQEFASMENPDLVSWNSLLLGCAQHGYGRDAVELFEEMRRIGVTPDRTTFLSVLTACSHAGLVEKGMDYFHLMNNGDPPIAPGPEHYACVVDLLGRAGHLKEAEAFVENMPMKPGVSVYKALVSACQVHGDVDTATRVAKHLLELWPDDSSTYVLLANAFAAMDCWDDAAGVRKAMSKKGLTKTPAQSWIDTEFLQYKQSQHYLPPTANMAGSLAR